MPSQCRGAPQLRIRDDEDHEDLPAGKSQRRPDEARQSGSSGDTVEDDADQPPAQSDGDEHDTAAAPFAPHGTANHEQDGIKSPPLRRRVKAIQPASLQPGRQYCQPSRMRFRARRPSWYGRAGHDGAIQARSGYYGGCASKTKIAGQEAARQRQCAVRRSAPEYGQAVLTAGNEEPLDARRGLYPARGVTQRAVSRWRRLLRQIDGMALFPIFSGLSWFESAVLRMMIIVQFNPKSQHCQRVSAMSSINRHHLLYATSSAAHQARTAAQGGGCQFVFTRPAWAKKTRRSGRLAYLELRAN